MAETRVISPRIGTDIVKSVFTNVKTRRTGANTVRVDAGAIVGADDGTDTLSLSAYLVIDGGTVGVDGLDYGALTDATWYAIWLIKEVGGDVTHGLLSTDFTSPAMPTGYTIKRRVGAVYYDEVITGGFVVYEQVGKRICYSNGKSVYRRDMPPSTWKTINLTEVVPTTVSVGYFQIRGPNTDSVLYISYDSVGKHFVGDSGDNGTDRQRGDGHCSLILPTQTVYIYRSGSHPGENDVTIYLSSYEDNLF